MLRLIYIHQCIKLLDIIAICIAVAILLHPEEKLSPMLCLYFEALVGFIRIDYYMAGFTIALGRWVRLREEVEYYRIDRLRDPLSRPRRQIHAT